MKLNVVETRRADPPLHTALFSSNFQFHRASDVFIRTNADKRRMVLAIRTDI